MTAQFLHDGGGGQHIHSTLEAEMEGLQGKGMVCVVL